MHVDAACYSMVPLPLTDARHLSKPTLYAHRAGHYQRILQRALSQVFLRPL